MRAQGMLHRDRGVVHAGNLMDLAGRPAAGTALPAQDVRALAKTMRMMPAIPW